MSAKEKKLGIIAGGGDLPKKLASYCTDNGLSPYIVAFKGQTDDDISEFGVTQYMHLGQLNRAITWFKSEGVSDIVFCGSIKKPNFFFLRPDWRAIKFFIKFGFFKKGDDALLSAIRAELESDGLNIIGVHRYLTDIIVPLKNLTVEKPQLQDWHSIKAGFYAAKRHGLEDKGQAVIVSQAHIIAKETQKGTDKLINSVNLPKDKRALLVKVCKPQQDMDLDLPTIGLKTIENAAKHNVVGIAVEAGASLILDQDHVVKRANELGLFVVGVSEESIDEHVS